MVWDSSPFFLALSLILALGLAMMGWPFFLASWSKLPKLLCIDVGLWENGGNAPKNVGKKDALKIEN
jgi:hypothetical protein